MSHPNSLQLHHVLGALPPPILLSMKLTTSDVTLDHLLKQTHLRLAKVEEGIREEDKKIWQAAQEQQKLLWKHAREEQKKLWRGMKVQRTLMEVEKRELLLRLLADDVVSVVRSAQGMDGVPEHILLKVLRAGGAESRRQWSLDAADRESLGSLARSVGLQCVGEFRGRGMKGHHVLTYRVKGTGPSLEKPVSTVCLKCGGPRRGEPLACMWGCEGEVR